MAIEITDSAVEQIKMLEKKRQAPPKGLRVGIRGGGCTGFSYLFEWSDKDPLKRLEQALREERTIDEAKLEGIRTTVKDEVHEAVERADDDGFADPSEAHLGVFAEADTDA